MKLSDSSPRAMRVTSCSRACAAPLRGVPTPRHASFRQRPGRRPLRYTRLRSVRGARSLLLLRKCTAIRTRVSPSVRAHRAPLQVGNHSGAHRCVVRKRTAAAQHRGCSEPTHGAANGAGLVGRGDLRAASGAHIDPATGHAPHTRRPICFGLALRCARRLSAFEAADCRRSCAMPCSTHGSATL